MLSWLKFVGSVVGRSQTVDRAPARRHAGSLFGANACEQLEQRNLLATGPVAPIASNTNSGAESAYYSPAVVNWHGFEVEALKGSWILTFRESLGKQQALARANQVVSLLGLEAESVEASTLGRFAEIRTRGNVTEARVAQAKQAASGWLQQIEPNLIKRTSLVPNDARYNEQYALNNSGQPSGNLGPGTIGADIEAEPAWNLTTGTRQVVVAVLDTGLDLQHPDIIANIYRNPGEIPNNGVDDDLNGFVDDVSGWDFAGAVNAGPDNNPQDPVAQGHGTAVAGTIGAVGNNGIGVAGVAWQISILPLKVFPDEGLANTFDIINANEYVAMMRGRGVNIVVSNNSYGALADENFDQFNDAEEISVQMVTDAGIVFVASAGNDTNDNDGSVKAYPASYNNPDIVSSAASNNEDVLAGFSNFGATTVDIAGPGEQVLTLEVGGGYQFINGTSFSGPYTAGVVAMMASLNRFADKTQLRTTLLATGDQIPALQGRILTGARINLFRALTAIGVPGPVVAAITPQPQSPPIDEIVVQFSKEIDPAFFSSANVRLVAANGDNLFNSNDITITPTSVSLDGQVLTISLAGDLPRDAYRLTLVNTGFRDTDGNFLNGGPLNGSDEVYDFNVVIFRGPLEPNDQVSEATPVVLDGSGSAGFDDLVIGDGLFNDLDIDMFRLFASGPSLVTITINAKSLPVPSELDSFIRLFDTNGVQLAVNDNFNGLDSKLEYFVPAGGFFYVGVSGYPNTAYLPTSAGSGIVADTLGTFGVSFTVFTPAPEQRTANNSTPVSIPDISVITSTINITDGRSIQDLNVRINISHSFVGDLRVNLTGPTGLVITLVNRRGGSGDNLTNTVFDKAAAVPVTSGSAPFTGVFRPEGDLAEYNNTSAAGTWTLTVQDFKAGDFGTLNNWELQLTLNNNLFGPFELNDQLTLGTNTDINGTGSRTFNAAIGDGAYGLRDVDLFRVVAASGTTIQAFAAPLNQQLDTVVRIFDAAGNELAIDRRKGSRTSTSSFIVVNGGVYYIGVSGGNTTNDLDFGNTAYNALVAGSGTETDATGEYAVLISVSGGVGESSVVLDGNQIGLGVTADGTIGVTEGDNPTGLRLGEIDFLLVGALESYFGVIADGFIGRNEVGTRQSDLALNVVNESDAFNRRVSTTGIFRSLQVRRALSFGIDDRFIAIDVTLRNQGSDTLNDVAWVEGFNPNQGSNFEGGTDETFNNIDVTGRLATATAFGLTVGLGTADSTLGEFASFENPGSVRDPFQVINTPVDPNSAEADLSMALAYNLGSLVSGQSVSFRYFIFMGTQTQVSSDFTALNTGTGEGHLVADPRDLDLEADELPYALYYPEGFANARSNTFIPMLNGQADGVRVVVIARYEGTAAPDVLYDSKTEAAGGLIGPNRRFGLTLTNPTLYAAGTATRVGSQFTGRPGVLKNVPYAIEILTSAPIGATFSHYDFNISTGEAFTSQTSTDWTFGDAAISRNERDFVLFYNPGTEPAKVTMTIYPEAGQTQAPVTSTIQIDGQRRGGWSLRTFNQLLPDGKYSIRLDSDLPIVAALTHFDISRAAGFATLGVPTTGNTAGSTGEGEFGVNATDEVITLLNTGTQTSTVTLTLNFSTGSAYRRTISAPAGKRTTVEIADLPGLTPGQPFSISYTANRPVSVNLSSYSFGEATGSSFVSAAATQHLFGEGFRPVNNPTRISDYLRVFNPASADARIAITINYNDGGNETFFQTVRARAASVFNLHDFITGVRRNQNAFFAVKVQSAVPITTFFGHFDQNLGGGFGSAGTTLGTLGAPA